MEVVALSGGKDSTALALALQEREPREDRVFFCTPTGDELPEMEEHWRRLETLLGQQIVYVRHKLSLSELIAEMGALPNHRMRWCTRMLKIQPCQAFLLGLDNPTICVGLRADEPQRKGAIYTGATERYPLREWGWGLDEVLSYLKNRGVHVPQRTDCARCYHQRLSEWHTLWSERPAVYQSAVDEEIATGHTFRSPKRDTWPASLSGLREEFRTGRLPRGMTRQLPLLRDDSDETPCRVCSL